MLTSASNLTFLMEVCSLYCNPDMNLNLVASYLVAFSSQTFCRFICCKPDKLNDGDISYFH